MCVSVSVGKDGREGKGNGGKRWGNQHRCSIRFLIVSPHCLLYHLSIIIVNVVVHSCLSSLSSLRSKSSNSMFSDRLRRRNGNLATGDYNIKWRRWVETLPWKHFLNHACIEEGYRSHSPPPFPAQPQDPSLLFSLLPRHSHLIIVVTILTFILHTLASPSSLPWLSQLAFSF